MGLFDKFKSKKTTPPTPAPAQPDLAAPADNAPQPSSDAAQRRFTLVVDDVLQFPDEEGVRVMGFVHGQVHTGDNIYLFQPNGQIIATTVDAVNIEVQGSSQSANNQSVVIHIRAAKSTNDLSPLTVITNIEPQMTFDINTPVENPQLLGLLNAYAQKSDNQSFMNLLCYALCHARYLAPFHSDTDFPAAHNGKITLPQGATLSFFRLPHADGSGKQDIPVFTDWTALAACKDAFALENPPKTMVLTFPDVATMAQHAQEDVIINPLSSTAFSLNLETINKITNLQAYRDEFGQNDTHDLPPNAVTQRHKEGATLKVRPLDDNQTTRKIKEILTALGNGDPRIQRIDLLMQMDEEGTQSCLCIFSCPQEYANTAITKIHEAIVACLPANSYMDFMLYDDADNFHPVLNEKTKMYGATPSASSPQPR